MWEAFGGVAAVLGLLGGIIKLLLDKYFKQAEELEHTKKTLAEKSINELKILLDQHKVELHKMREELSLNTKSIAKADRDLQKFTEDLRSYIDESNTRIQRIETSMIKLSDELLLIKGQRNVQRQKN